MRVIGFAVVLILSQILAPLAAEAQQAGKVHRVGWLMPTPLPTTLDEFRDGLRRLGYVEGHNVVIEQRYAPEPERLIALVTELVRINVDVIVTFGNSATLAAKDAAGSIPVVFVAGSPVEIGIVASLARPGGT